MYSSDLMRKFPFIQEKSQNTHIFKLIQTFEFTKNFKKISKVKPDLSWSNHWALSKNAKLNCKVFFGMLTTLFRCKKVGTFEWLL